MLMMKSTRCLIRGTLALMGLGLALAVFSPPLSGQTEAQRLIQQASGQELTQSQILERLRASGISREDARAVFILRYFSNTIAYVEDGLPIV
jgi:hypothetical protein